jgi:hypothetical protein
MKKVRARRKKQEEGENKINGRTKKSGKQTELDHKTKWRKRGKAEGQERERGTTRIENITRNISARGHSSRS